jgi:aminomethyltransferase
MLTASDVLGLARTPFHDRTAALNRKGQWREWSGFAAASAYADGLDIEYNAIRQAVGLIDVSPLFKYSVRGPDARTLVDRVQVRDASKLARGQVYYTCWCDEDGKVIDDGTIARLDDDSYRWTAADPSLRWLRMNSTGLDVDVSDVTNAVGALAIQGPRSRSLLERLTGQEWADLRYFRRRRTEIGGVEVDVSRTGYTGDLGYELWVAEDDALTLWDAVILEGEAFGARPAGMLALDVARVEAGLILLDVDYTTVRRALIPEQAFSPFELGILGVLVRFDKGPFVGKRALEAELRAGGPARRLVGLEVEWSGIERAFGMRGLTPHVAAEASRVSVPVFQGARQVGKATTTAWSPTLKQAIALASVESRASTPGTLMDVEWTVEARRGSVPATVTTLPFFDPPRKRA